MEPAEIVEREDRLGRTVGVLGLLGALAIIIWAFGGIAADFTTLAPDAYAERFEAFSENEGAVLASGVLLALGMALMVPPLTFLFRAAANRSPLVRRSLIGLTIAGPLFLGFSFIAQYAAYKAGADTFIDGAPAGGDINQFAEDTLVDQTAFSIFSSLQIAGLVATLIAVVYTALQAMRAGLLTRFLGTLGMALGAGVILLGPLSLGVFTLFISLLIAGWWRGPRPPAWETGEAIPWPKPGDPPPPSSPEEPADAAEFEGTGRELDDAEGAQQESTESYASEMDADFGASAPAKKKKKKKRT